MVAHGSKSLAAPALELGFGLADDAESHGDADMIENLDPDGWHRSSDERRRRSQATERDGVGRADQS